MTENQDKRKVLLNGLGIFLTDFGYKKKSFTFRRATENGLIQLIELRLGPSWSSSSGQINLEFGIFSDEWHQFLNRYKMPSTLRTADCEIRDCYCKIIELNQNQIWHQLSNDLESLTKELTSVVKCSILPFFDRHQTRQQIIESYKKNGQSIGLPPRHRLSIAVLYYGAGYLEESQSILNEEFEKNSKNPFYIEVHDNLTQMIQKTKAQPAV